MQKRDFGLEWRLFSFYSLTYFSRAGKIYIEKIKPKGIFEYEYEEAFSNALLVYARFRALLCSCKL